MAAMDPVPMLLHGPKTNKNVLKVIVAAAFVGVCVKLVENFEMGVSNKTPDFRKLNPIGKIPVLETPDGPFYGSNVIAHYVARSNSEAHNLFGSSDSEIDLIDHWTSCASSIEAKLLIYIKQKLNLCPSISAEQAKDSLNNELQILDEHLESKQFLVGTTVTLADIILTCNLIPAFRLINVENLIPNFSHVNDYFWRMVSLPEFQEVSIVLQSAKQKGKRKMLEELGEGVDELDDKRRKQKDERPFKPSVSH